MIIYLNAPNVMALVSLVIVIETVACYWSV